MRAAWVFLLAGIVPAQEAAPDPRDVQLGHAIPDEGYCDQPRIVVTSKGTWVCVLTTGPGHEGQSRQHVIATRSSDRGQTWSEPVDVEPSDPDRPASYAVAWITPFDRIYAFYTYNGDAVWTLPGSEERIRADTHGWWCYRYSDDEGRTWSPRHRIPMRVTDCDRTNDWKGEVQMFWAIGKPVETTDGAVVFGFTKLARYFLQGGEGWFWRSDNLGAERDPVSLRFELLPDGDRGLRNEAFGSVQEEFNVAPLSDGGLYCVYRTTMGHPAESYSRDGGRTWSAPEPMRYAPGGRIVRNPRACPKVWRTREGRYLFWFHNHGGTGFLGRNPAWILGGIERGGRIHWSQPEIVLYGSDPQERYSYPDLVEDGGRWFLAETQKSEARVHEVDPALLAGTWAQLTEGWEPEPVRDAVLVEREGGGTGPCPELPDLSKGRGFSLELWLDLAKADEEKGLVEARDGMGQTLALLLEEEAGTARVRLELGNGEVKATWLSDPLPEGTRHHVVFTVDGGPKLITVVTDGRLDDGGDLRPQGFGRFVTQLGRIAPSAILRTGPAVERLWVHGRALLTAEAVANHRAGRGQ